MHTDNNLQVTSRKDIDSCVLETQIHIKLYIYSLNSLITKKNRKRNKT